MKLKLRLTFNDQEREALLDFQRKVNIPGETAMTLEHLCRQAIFLTIQQTLKQADKLQQQYDLEKQQHEQPTNVVLNNSGEVDEFTTERVTDRDNGQTPIGGNTDSDLLAETSGAESANV